MTATFNPHRRCVMAFAKRAWIQQGITTLLLAALLGGLFGVLIFLATDDVNALATMPDLVPSNTNGLVTVATSSGEFLPVTSYFLLMTPAILGTLIAIVATLTLPGVVADDITGGGIEALLAGPIPRRALFTAYLGAALVLASAAWAVAMLAFFSASLITAVVTGASVAISWVYAIALVVIPFSMGLWSATATLFGALLYPSSLDTKAGMNGGPIRLVAVLPALIAIPSVLSPDRALPALGLVFVLTTMASLLLIQLTSRGFRSTRVLGS